MPNPLRVSITSNEIVMGGASVEIQSPEPIDPKSAQGSIQLRENRVTVVVSDDGLTATVVGLDGKPLPPGSYTLVIDQLLSAKGSLLESYRVIPFQITDSAADLGGTVQIQTMSRLSITDLETIPHSISNRPKGTFIEVIKAVDRGSGEPISLSVDQDGKAVDAEKLLAVVAKNRLEKFGCLDPVLYERIEESPEKEVRVAIWLKTDAAAPRAEKSPKERSAGRPREEERAAEVAKELVGNFAERISGAAADIEVDTEAPLLYVTMTGARLRELAQDDQVAAVFLHDAEQILDVGTSMSIANSDDVHTLGFTGAGINVAVWEDGPDQTNLLPITATFDPNFVGTSTHARHTHGIVSNTEANRPHGHAPGCNLHSANRGGTDALLWAARQGCTVISQSFHRSTEPGSSTLQSDDVLKDWLALRWPDPTIVQAAGNYWKGDDDNITPPESEFVNHKTFNGLTVGNHNDTAAAMSGDSVFRNPASTHGDRELPEISANGMGVTCVGLTKSGTSMAAPSVAGCVALIQDADGVLESWPEGCRAIVMAGATRNVNGREWWTDVSTRTDASDGAGAIDALESLRITQSRQSRNNRGTRRGWDVGTLRSADIGERNQTTFSYRLTVPRSLWFATAKVSLAWDSAVTTRTIFGIEVPLSSTLGVDLDLQVFDANNAQVGYSGSFDNSYEIAEFGVSAGETYTIKIRRWSGTADVWFGIAWAVTRGITLSQLDARLEREANVR